MPSTSLSRTPCQDIVGPSAAGDDVASSPSGSSVCFGGGPLPCVEAVAPPPCWRGRRGESDASFLRQMWGCERKVGGRRGEGGRRVLSRQGVRLFDFGKVRRERCGNTCEAFNPYRESERACSEPHARREPQSTAADRIGSEGHGCREREEARGSAPLRHGGGPYGASGKNKIGKCTMMPIVLIQFQRCKSHVELAYTLSSVCAAGIIHDSVELRGGFIRHFMKDSMVFSEATQAWLKYTGRGVRNRKIHWRPKSRCCCDGAYKKG